MDIAPDCAEPTRQEWAALAVALEEAVQRATGVDVEAIGTPGVGARRALRVLHALRRTREALAELEAHAAETAGAGGATYADIGTAVGVSRQAARNRWPGAVPGARPGRPALPATQAPEAAEEDAELQLERALAAWPALLDPQTEPCWVAMPAPGQEGADRTTWPWRPGQVMARVAPNEWHIALDEGDVFRDHTELRPRGIDTGDEESR